MSGRASRWRSRTQRRQCRRCSGAPARSSGQRASWCSTTRTASFWEICSQRWTASQRGATRYVYVEETWAEKQRQRSVPSSWGRVKQAAACASVHVCVPSHTGRISSSLLHPRRRPRTQEHIRPKLLSLSLALPEEVAPDEKKKGKGGGGKGKGGGKTYKIPAKTQIKIDNVMRIMAGDAAKDKGKKTQAKSHTLPFFPHVTLPFFFKYHRRAFSCHCPFPLHTSPTAFSCRSATRPSAGSRRSRRERTWSSTRHGSCSSPKRWAWRRRF